MTNSTLQKTSKAKNQSIAYNAALKEIDRVSVNSNFRTCVFIHDHDLLHPKSAIINSGFGRGWKDVTYGQEVSLSSRETQLAPA